MNFLFNEVTPAKTTVQFNKRGQGGLASYWYSTLDHLQVYQCIKLAMVPYIVEENKSQMNLCYKGYSCTIFTCLHNSDTYLATDL